MPATIDSARSRARLDLRIGRAAPAVDHVLEPGPDHTAPAQELACRQLANQRHDAGSRDQRPVEVEHREARQPRTKVDMPAVTELARRGHDVTVPTADVGHATAA
jgi:hypothetical protein